MIIDMHTHAYPEPYLELVAERGEDSPIRFRREGEGWARYRGERRLGTVDPAFYRPEVRLAEMDRQGVDVQVVSLTTPTVAWADPELGTLLARVVNDALARMSREAGSRFVPVAALPLQSVEAACRELERAVEQLGMRMAYVGSQVRGRPLDHPDFAPLYDVAQSLGVTLMLHPQFRPGDPRLEGYHLDNLVAFPFENTLAVARLLFSGTFRRYPRLRWYVTHLGGALRAVRGRWLHGYTAFPDLRETLPDPPERWWDPVTFDTVCFDDSILGAALEWPGAKRLVFGTDYPFNMADPEGPARIERVVPPGDAREAIFSANARNLLDL